jgi:hypothetical protein
MTRRTVLKFNGRNFEDYILLNQYFLYFFVIYIAQLATSGDRDGGGHADALAAHESRTDNPVGVYGPPIEADCPPKYVFCSTRRIFFSSKLSDLKARAHDIAAATPLCEPPITTTSTSAMTGQSNMSRV